MQGQSRIIETGRRIGQYDMHYIEAIIEHPKHGRLYIAQGFCGQDKPVGGAYRWSGGIVIALRPGDTLDSLRTIPDGDVASPLEMASTANDETRPLLEWDGCVIELIEGLQENSPDTPVTTGQLLSVAYELRIMAEWVGQIEARLSRASNVASCLANGIKPD